jgi:hypothetical protein
LAQSVVVGEQPVHCVQVEGHVYLTPQLSVGLLHDVVYCWFSLQYGSFRPTPSPFLQAVVPV